MGLIAVASMAGAQGVTTTALGLAACWPEGEAVPVLVECDPSGGDLAARWNLEVRPGLAETGQAAAATDQPGPEVLTAGAQQIEVAGRDVTVVCASLGGAEVAPALAVLAAPGSKAMHDPDGWIVADLGRLDEHSPTWPLVAAADCTVLVARSHLEGLAHLRGRFETLARRFRGRFTVALTPGAYRPNQAQDLLRAAGLTVPVAGLAGPARPIGPDPIGWRGRRALGTWHDLAAAVRDRALAQPPLAIEAGTRSGEERS
ncbi:hypothetical protein O1R50_09035 [Glycomyces luteolus]|uniref:MinD-like ATPase involved in chromosome partitioning or flagellar assembly n=1 Tax=Glycomyces luteolus TaxID=2670330 RepID=A0A9X3PJM3_9ACTN|nr:hypothetical protein [Glycomyces luteolus]MDA1359765.1 hypothetical protein [Glycomyces luteolus]